MLLDTSYTLLYINIEHILNIIYWLLVFKHVVFSIIYGE